MSIADRGSARGFTIFEVIVTIGILSVMFLIMEGTLDSTRRAERRLEAMARVTDRGEKVSYELLDAVNASHRLFGADAIGTGYLAALDLTRLPMMAGARLPVIDEVGRLAPDAAGDPHTGNVLLFVRESMAAEGIANAGTGAVRHVDLYRFVCVYPHTTARRLIVDPPIQNARDLVVWTSERYASQQQLLDIEDATERSSVVADLFSRFGVDYAWDANAAVGAAFYAMDALGNLAATPTAGLGIPEDLDASAGGRFTYADVQLAPTVAGDYHRRSLMTNDPPAAWLPDGFEVKIVGLTGSRRVWMHLVLESPGGKGVVGVHADTVISSPRDL